MTFSEAQAILNRISYKPGWLFCLEKKTEDTWLLWMVFETIDAIDGILISLESRSWYVDPTFSEQDLIGTAFLAIKQTEEHEMLEFFRVDGLGIFNPHITISAHKRAYRESFAV